MGTDTIRSLNDRFRKRDTEIPGQTVLTRGLHEMVKDQPLDQLRLLRQVAEYDNFTPDNDPHGEHDFGAFTFDQQSCFWKIDCYDPSLKYGSEDPTDLENSYRVMTIMLASEY